ncbi:MAG: hypothetical protein NTY47_01480, partial [Candidatus Omnitrophica bacterium]|nr:hypothetical protein [Candidatus Omnitrophota bacterium]
MELGRKLIDSNITSVLVVTGNSGEHQEIVTKFRELGYVTINAAGDKPEQEGAIVKKAEAVRENQPGKKIALIAADATDGINLLKKIVDPATGKAFECALIDASGKDQSIRIIQREGRLLGEGRGEGRVS